MPDDSSHANADAADSTPNDVHDGPQPDASPVDRGDEQPPGAVPESHDGYEPL